MTTPSSTARLNFRLAPDHKKEIEDAAAQMGQTVSDFAVSTLVQAARRVLQEQEVMRLTARDRDLFLAMLDDTTTRPNEALRKAARRHKKEVRE